ncbi:MAG TPA: 16S rRNA (uracil(1498)-N(3))-methyltransferase [Terriglobia bacterium]|nr:16S rRNA (uracil(1498)-N(3))-methyltransferase [Terriglobia bacterium]
MSNRRLYLQTPPCGESAVLSGSEAHHLIHVLRARSGDRVELIDGSGRVWTGEVAEIGPASVDLSKVTLIVEESPSSTSLILLQSLCRPDKLEWILQKTTELGITEIYLVETRRSVARIPLERIEAKMDRWKKIIIGAAKQSRRETLPLLHPPVNCRSASEQANADLKILFSENQGQRNLKSLMRMKQWNSVAFSIGPEGGWTADEESQFLDNQFQPVSLGTHILRTETAAIAALAVLKYELEDSLASTSN